MGTTAVIAEHAGHRRGTTAYCYWDLVPSPFREYFAGRRREFELALAPYVKHRLLALEGVELDL